MDDFHLFRRFYVYPFAYSPRDGLARTNLLIKKIQFNLNLLCATCAVSNVVFSRHTVVYHVVFVNCIKINKKVWCISLAIGYITWFFVSCQLSKIVYGNGEKPKRFYGQNIIVRIPDMFNSWTNVKIVNSIILCTNQCTFDWDASTSMQSICLTFNIWIAALRTVKKEILKKKKYDKIMFCTVNSIG